MLVLQLPFALILVSGLLVGWTWGQNVNYKSHWVSAGDHAKLQCGGGNKNATFVTIPQTLMSVTKNFDSSRPLEVNQSGVYICKDGQAQTVHYVHVQGNGEKCGLMLPIAAEQSKLNVTQDMELVVPCRAFGQGVNLSLEATRKCNMANTTVEYDVNRGFVVNKVQLNFSGSWQCVARYTNCSHTQDINVTVLSLEDSPQSGGVSQGPLIAGVVVLSLVLVVCIPYLVFRLMRKRRRTRLSKNDLRLFLEGAVDTINPELGIDQQADLLPYNAHYEFPRENLKLGRQLGSGAYGRVVKAEADGLLYGAFTLTEDSVEKKDGPTTVAVKMIKPHAEVSHLKALMTELKILIHVGKHLNVVNLMGACTTNLANKELLVIVEYCRFGNLHSYLLRERETFLDQVDHESDTLDFTIGASADNDASGTDGYLKMSGERQVSFNEDRSSVAYDPAPPPSSSSGGQYVLGTDSSGSGSQHCTPKYSGDVRPAEEPRVSTKDLVCWSYQVARGMEYLASRKIVHADLAARNLLLAENNVVKICDFGLARNLYADANYLKKSNDALPLKWMAIESIRDRVFCTPTDVWSFGVVMWEFFTLAMTPYPGIPLDDNFLNRLLDGYRMDKPEYCTRQLYATMKSCWEERPANRPSFSQLVSQFGDILDDNVKQMYLILSDPYVRMNSELQRERISVGGYVLPTDELFNKKSESQVTPSSGNHYQNPVMPVQSVLGKMSSEARVPDNVYKEAPTDKTQGYVNLSLGTAGCYAPLVDDLEVAAPTEGYLRMSPIPSKD